MSDTQDQERGSMRRLWLLGAGLALTSLAVSGALVRPLAAPHGSVRIPWLALAAVFCAAEVFVVHMQFRRGDAHSFSLSEVPLVLGLFFVEPLGLVAAQALGSAVALIVHRRQSPVKVVFNLGHLTLEAGLAAFIFHSLRGSAVVGPSAWGSTFAATIAYAVIASGLVAIAISISQGTSARSTMPRGFAFALVVAVSNTCLGLLGVHVLRTDPVAAWLLLAPAVVVFLAYRAFGTQRAKHESMQFLYESTRLLQRSIEIDETLKAVLDQGRKMLRADIASITFLPVDGEAPQRATTGPAEYATGLVPVALDAREGVWARVASESQALLLPRPIRNERLRAHFATRGVHDAMVAPIFGESGVVGTFLVGNRLGDVSTFDEADLRMFETLANHASIAIRNARLVTRLQDALERQTELGRMKDDFVATVSHELRTPLTSILGFLQTMLRPAAEFSAEEKHSFLEIIDRQAHRLSCMIEDLLMVSRVETKTMTAASRLVSVERIVRSVVADLGPRMGTHEVALSFDGVPPLHTDEEFVYRVVSNLVDNALKYSPEGSRVSIVAAQDADGVRISVEDQGEGIPAHLRERVFERFFQADQSRTRAVGGAGLGLYICRGLSEALHGRLTLDRSTDNGSMFSLWIPAGRLSGVDAQVGAVEQAATPPARGPVPEAPGAGDFAAGSARNN